MSDVPLPNERWTVEVDFPDRESTFAAARKWADERGDTAVAWCYPTWYGPADAEGEPVTEERAAELIDASLTRLDDLRAGR